MKLRTIAAIWIALQATAVAAAEPDPAIAVRHRTAERLAYRVQAIRDRIGVQCQRLALRDIADCEARNYDSYYKILDGIKRAESSDETMTYASYIIYQFEAKVDQPLADLERSMAR